MTTEVTMVVAQYHEPDEQGRLVVAYHEDALVAKDLANALTREVHAMFTEYERWREKHPRPEYSSDNRGQHREWSDACRDECERILAAASEFARTAVTVTKLRYDGAPTFELETVKRIPSPTKWERMIGRLKRGETITPVPKVLQTLQALDVETHAVEPGKVYPKFCSCGAHLLDADCCCK